MRRRLKHRGNSQAHKLRVETLRSFSAGATVLAESRSYSSYFRNFSTLCGPRKSYFQTFHPRGCGYGAVVTRCVETSHSVATGFILGCIGFQDDRLREPMTLGIRESSRLRMGQELGRPHHSARRASNRQGVTRVTGHIETCMEAVPMCIWDFTTKHIRSANMEIIR